VTLDVRGDEQVAQEASKKLISMHHFLWQQMQGFNELLLL
jgi:hypothetical protein